MKRRGCDLPFEVERRNPRRTCRQIHERATQTRMASQKSFSSRDGSSGQTRVARTDRIPLERSVSCVDAANSEGEQPFKDKDGRLGLSRLDDSVARMLTAQFFCRDTSVVARELIGKLIRRKINSHWLAARIVETEAYFIHELGSHASQGRTKSREALFAPPGTIYMYYSRAGDSLNVSTQGGGNAVLIKAAEVHFDELSPPQTLQTMQELNPKRGPSGASPREVARQCAGQTLLCKSLGITVPDWNGFQFQPSEFFIEDDGLEPDQIVVCRRLGIPKGRDEDLLLRFVDAHRISSATQSPYRGSAPNEKHTQVRVLQRGDLYNPLFSHPPGTF